MWIDRARLEVDNKTIEDLIAESMEPEKVIETEEVGDGSIDSESVEKDGE